MAVTIHKGRDNVTKRVLLGRPLRSDTLGHTLLPKRVALPVFASDALSSVAYAPEEIFLVLSVAGLSAYAFSGWIGLAVAVVLVVGSRATGRTSMPTPPGVATTKWRRRTSVRWPA